MCPYGCRYIVEAYGTYYLYKCWTLVATRFLSVARARVAGAEGGQAHPALGRTDSALRGDL